MSEPLKDMQNTEEGDVTVTATPVAEPIEVEEAAPADNSDAEMDAVLDRILGFDEPEPTRDSPVTPAAPDADYQKALKALQRDGVPKDVIDGLKNDPARLKEWGLKAAKRQADVDSFGAKVANAKDATNESETPNGSPSDSAQTGDGEGDADPLSEFGEIFGEEAAKPLRAMKDRLMADFEAKTKALELQQQTTASYARLSSKYGANTPDFADVVRKAADIGEANPAAFDSVDAIVAEAFRQLAKEPVRKDPRSIARPTVGKSTPRPQREVYKEDMALDILLSGGSRDDVRRVITR